VRPMPDPTSKPPDLQELVARFGTYSAIALNSMPPWPHGIGRGGLTS
jgi:hypothetical protein